MRILVPVDGSAGALRAVKHSAAVVKEGAEVELVNVQPPMPLYGMVRAYMRAPQYRAACAALAEKALNPAVKLLKRARVAHRTHVMYGEPGATIADAARRLKCRAIVMGAWGHSRLRELILGGVTRTLLESMTVPVLMAH